MSCMEAEIKQMKEHKSYRAMVEELSFQCIKEEIKRKKEYIICTLAEEEYNTRSFFVKLFNKMDNPYEVCKAILDEMDRGKEMSKNIYAEIEHGDAIWVMMYAMTKDDYIAMEKIAGIDYSVDNRFYDEDEELLEYEKQMVEELEEYKEPIYYEDYLYSLFKERCDQQEEESKKNRETLLEKDNTDNNSFDTTYATESTDSTSVSVKHCETDNIKTLFNVNETTKIGIQWNDNRMTLALSLYLQLTRKSC